MTYQLETYRSSKPREKNGGKNWMIASTSARTTKASITSGNSAHSSGWLNPASTSTQPGATTAKFHSPNIHCPSRALVTDRPVSKGTAW